MRRGLEEFATRTGADELMVTANIYDHEKRKRSFAIIAEIGGVKKQADVPSQSKRRQLVSSITVLRSSVHVLVE